MTSLSDAYERRSGQVSRERLYVGTGLFGVGALVVVVGIVVLTTRIALPADFTMTQVYGARELAGTLVGLGIPAVFLGIFAVLPANRLQQAAAAAGGLLTLTGIVIFRSVYPYQWFSGLGIPSSGVVALVAVYAVGIMTVMWCLFTAIATFKRRNAPGGTVTMTYTHDGETHTVEVAEEDLDDARAALSGGAFGGVGVFGDVESLDVDHPATTADGGSTSNPTTPGTTTADTPPASASASALSGPQTAQTSGVGPDKYCGNCIHFDYVRTDDGLQPYCHYHDELMDGVEACPQWTRNDGSGRQSPNRI